jgi:aldose 1-epimerase
MNALSLAAVALLAAADKPGIGPAVEQEPFGKLPGGQTVTSYTLISKSGAKAKIIDYGAILTSWTAPDKSGAFGDVVLGFDNIEGYLAGHPYFGSNVGRCANRIANAKFTLDGKEFKLAANNGDHALHGGKEGFDKKMWRAEPNMSAAGPVVKLSYTSKAGEEGYPGDLSVVMQYTLTGDNELRIDYTATSTAATPCNIAHHSYFNLAGKGDILGHEAQFFASKYTPADATLIPTGKIDAVAGTPFDFTTPTAIGKRLKDAGGKPVGYDLNYVIDRKTGGLAPCAIVTEPTTGRVLEVSTTEPGLQFYSGNFLDGTNKGKSGAVYNQYGGFCLEPQKFPDSINKPEWKDVSDVVLRPGQEYRQTTVYKVGVKK